MNTHVLWCSSYHVCLTRRSTVRSWTASESELSWKWWIRTVQRFCLLKIIFQLTPEKGPNMWRKYIRTCEVFPKFSTNALMTKISGLQNKKKKLLEKAQVLWCSGYHVCLTRRSTIRSWTASESQLSWKWWIGTVQRFCSLEIMFQLTPEKLPDMWRKYIKTCEVLPKFSTNALMTTIPGLRNNKKKLLGKYQVLWCSGYHVWLTRRRSPVGSWTTSENHLSLKWLKRNVQRFCSLEIIFQLTPEKLPNTWRKFIETCEIFPKFSTNALIIKIPVCKTRKRSYLRKLSCCGVAVITSASHVGLNSILDSIRKSTIMKMMNKDCTKNLLVGNYVSTNSRKIAWHVTKIH